MIKRSYAALLLAGAMLLTGCQPKADAASTNDPVKAVIEIVNGKTKAGSAQASPQPAAVNTQAMDPSIADTSFTLAASGDVLSHITNTESAQQPDGSYDYLPHFQEIEELLANADYTLVNLESAVAGEKYGYRGFPKFNAPVNLAETMKKIGVDMVITANNHAMDSGIKGLRDNLDNLDKIGLDYTGTFRSKEEADKPTIRDIKGIKVGFVAFSYGTNYIPVPNSYAVNLNSAKRIRAEIKEARDGGAELIVFHVHWGAEYTGYPTQTQMDVYKVLEEEGVDIVIGSHPHRLQPMELREIVYEGKKKTQAVIWSTGNLYQGQIKDEDYINIGSVFRIDVVRRNGIVRISGLDYDLVWNLRWKDASGDETYKVIPMSRMDEFKADFPNTYKIMKKEYLWANQTLNKSVKVIFSDGTASPSN